MSFRHEPVGCFALGQKFSKKTFLDFLFTSTRDFLYCLQPEGYDKTSDSEMRDFKMFNFSGFFNILEIKTFLEKCSF